MAHNLALIGYPLNHSFSPYIHSYFLSKYGINGGYNTFSLAEQVELPVLMHFLERFGFTGLNITAPHKRAIIEQVQDVDDTVRATGVANTLKMTRDGWVAHNTDTYGFARLLELNNVSLDAKNILIAGAGGAAGAVLHVLQSKGVKDVTITNRGEEKVNILKENFTDLNISYTKYQGLKEKHSFDIVINCSSADWSNKIWLDHFWGDDKDIFGGHTPETAIDLQYAKPDGAAETGFLSRWKSPQKIDGFVMLLEQAAKAFEIWFNILPEYSLEDMKQIAYKQAGK